MNPSVELEARSRLLYPNSREYKLRVPTLTVELAMKAMEARKRLFNLTEWFHATAEMHESVGISVSWLMNGSTYHSLTASVFSDETSKWETDNEATKKRMAIVVRAAIKYGCKIEKEYSGDDFNLFVYLPTGERLCYYSKREVVCTAKVVGRKWIEGSTTVVESKFVDEIEWDCEPVSLLAIPTDA